MRFTARTAAITLILGLFALLFVGCGAPSHPLVGSWRGEGPGPSGKNATSTITFLDDGTLKQTVVDGSHTMVINARYTATNGKMTQTVESVTVDGKSVKPSGNLKTEMGYVVNGDELVLGTSGVNNITLKKVEP